MMNFTIIGDTPSKKNSRVPFVRNGRMMNFPSKRYNEWHKSALTQLISQKNAVFSSFPLNYVDYIKIEIYPSNKRLFDLDNRLGSVMDILVDSGILSDDTYLVVPKIIISIMPLLKNSGKTEIFLNAVE